jgi:hypothetical protein
MSGSAGQKGSGPIEIVSVVAGGPAADAGLRAGDCVVAVDDLAIGPGMTPDDVAGMLLGRLEEPVKVTVEGGAGSAGSGGGGGGGSGSGGAPSGSGSGGGSGDWRDRGSGSGSGAGSAIGSGEGGAVRQTVTLKRAVLRDAGEATARVAVGKDGRKIGVLTLREQSRALPCYCLALWVALDCGEPRIPSCALHIGKEGHSGKCTVEATAPLSV